MEASTGPGATPVLDIGGNVGALVVCLASPPPTAELECCPVGSSRRIHTGVHLRTIGASSVYVAVFPSLVQGTYDVLDERGRAVARTEVAGGEVTDLDLRRGFDGRPRP